MPADADAVGVTRIEGGRSHAHGRQPHEAVKGGHQLRQRRHRNVDRDVCVYGAANENAGEDEPIALHDGGREGRTHREHHAGNDVKVAARAVWGDESPRSVMMKQMAAAR